VGTLDAELLVPQEPESLEETGLPESLIEQLILKVLYFRGEIYGQDLSTAIGLRFSVIDDLLESLKFRHYVQVKRSLGMGSVASVLALTEAGRERAREYLEANQYAGPAPVPLTQYSEMVRRQKPRQGWIGKEALARAFRGMVMTERVLAQVGPAVSASNSLLLYGKPGDGKTFLIESLNNLDTAPIFLPHALECQGNIVQLFDPIYHFPIEEQRSSPMSVAVERSPFDRRWIKCRRPFIVTGGELSLDMLDLQYNHTSKIYEAPFQLKANNGTYLIDDFGRQRATPAEVLNRWIVPMERRVDYLSFLTGGKMSVPFETFLVFSTNLNPDSLGDEAFLRRIQYKILLRGPAENEFVRIFESFCLSHNLACSRETIGRFIERHYRHSGKALRRCHPRDVLTHALNLMQFEKLPLALTDPILDRAFESCFLQEASDTPVAEAALLPVAVQSCADFWDDRLTPITTVFGGLVFAAGRRDRISGKYQDADSAQAYGEAETHRVLARLHTRAFTEWMGLTPAQQGRDLALYMASKDSNGLKLSAGPRALANQLAPLGASQEDVDRFAGCLAAVLAPSAVQSAPEAMERIA
jgi:DNA-binding MarR family transcriptional regulator